MQHIVMSALIEVHNVWGDIAWESCMNGTDKDAFGYSRRINISCPLLFIVEKSQTYQQSYWSFTIL